MNRVDVVAGLDRIRASQVAVAYRIARGSVAAITPGRTI
ncbi:hypothetical protein ACUXPF_002698 [Sphingomonas sanguinis]